MKLSEVKRSEVKGGKRDFMGRVYMSIKVVRSEGVGWKCEYSVCGEIY